MLVLWTIHLQQVSGCIIEWYATRTCFIISYLRGSAGMLAHVLGPFVELHIISQHFQDLFLIHPILYGSCCLETLQVSSHSSTFKQGTCIRQGSEQSLDRSSI
jgi:hypothetical protein